MLNQYYSNIHSVKTTYCLIAFLSLLTLNCNLSSRRMAIEEIIVDSVYCPIKLSEIAFNGVNSNFGIEENIEYLNGSTCVLNVFELGNEKISFKKDLSKYCNTIADYFVKSKDSIYIVSEKNEILLLSKDTIVKTWDINSIVHEIDSFAFCANVGPCLLAVNGETLLIDLSNSRVKSSFNTPPQDFYRYGYKILVDISQATPKLIAKYNPYPTHFQNQDYYSFYQGCITQNKELIYGFDYSDTIVKVNLLTKKTESIILHSEFFTQNSPLNYDSIFDFNYINSYTISQSRISLIMYNPIKKQFYIFIKHKSQAIDADGVQKEYYDCPFSLIILSEDFNTQKEYFIPANYLDKLYLSFTTKDHLYVPTDQTKQLQKGKTLYYRLNTSL